MAKTLLTTVIFLSTIMMLEAGQLVRAQYPGSACPQGTHSCQSGCCDDKAPQGRYNQPLF